MKAPSFTLSVPDDVLQQLLGPYDPDDIDTNDVEETTSFLRENSNHLHRRQQSNINHNHQYAILNHGHITSYKIATK